MRITGIPAQLLTPEAVRLLQDSFAANQVALFKNSRGELVADVPGKDDVSIDAAQLLALKKPSAGMRLVQMGVLAAVPKLRAAEAQGA